MTDTTSVERLKPCPFCGSAANVDLTADTKNYEVYCSANCGAQVVNARQAEAIAAWNRRPHPVPSQGVELLAALKAEEPNMGWRGHGPNDQEVFYCEFCAASDADSNKILHSPTCFVTKVRAAIAKAEATLAPDGDEIGYLKGSGFPKLAADKWATPSDAAEREGPYSALVGQTVLYLSEHGWRYSDPDAAHDAVEHVVETVKRDTLRNQSPAVGEEELKLAHSEIMEAAANWRALSKENRHKGTTSDCEGATWKHDCWRAMAFEASAQIMEKHFPFLSRLTTEQQGNG